MNKTPLERLYSKVDFDGPSGCWIWTAAIHKESGYGRFLLGGSINSGYKYTYAHRASWILHKGEIPNNLNVLHKCDIHACVNPDHLFLGTHLDNMRDKAAKGRSPGRKKITHCNRGHELTDDNCYVSKLKTGVIKRACRECIKLGDKIRSKGGSFILSTKDRFESKFEIADTGCWIWSSPPHPNGYGQFSFGKEVTYSHIASYRIYKSEVPKGMKVLHSCDTMLCVNPEHLSLGTQEENMAEMAKRGRARNGWGDSRVRK